MNSFEPYRAIIEWQKSRDSLLKPLLDITRGINISDSLNVAALRTPVHEMILRQEETRRLILDQLKILQDYTYVAKQAQLSLAASLSSSVKAIHETLAAYGTAFDRISQMQSFASVLPNEVYPRFETLTSAFTDVLPQLEDDEDFPLDDIEFEPGDSVESESPDVKQINWYQVVTLLIAIMTFLYPIYKDYLADNEQQHEIEMLTEQHKELEEKFIEFINYVEPFIPVSDDSEARSESDQ